MPKGSLFCSFHSISRVVLNFQFLSKRKTLLHLGLRSLQSFCSAMGTTGENWNDDDYSVIGDKGEIGFIDYEDDKSVCSYYPSEEGPVVISVPFAFVNGKPRSVFVGETLADAITIKNTTEDPVELWGVKIYASNPENTFTLSLIEPPSAKADERTIKGFVDFECLEDRVLQPHEELTVWLSCKPKEIGLHTTAVHFDVGEDRIERVVFLLAEDKISHSLTSKKPYSRGAKKKQVNVDAYVVGLRPARVTNRGFKNRLLEYKIPKDVREMVESKQIPDVLNEEMWSGNYTSYFKMLLIMEEIQLEEDIRSHDMESVTMRRKGNQYLALEVPGLAEKRPSLVQGDYILSRLASGGDGNAARAYQGFIHRVEADEVYLKFDKDFHLCHRDGNLYDVKFTYNRVNMRRLYQAIEAAECLETNFLFPSESLNRRVIETAPLSPISCTLNEEQICAIEKILGCEGAPPYVIHGPPGTGKTMTLVEAILQLYRHRENARILVCAPSNTAADNILEKLLSEKAVELKENAIFRLNATTRPYEDVKPDLIRFCFFDELIFKCPPLNALMCYRIIISTYMSASLLYAEGIDRGHFTYIFLDEAGQASEPETMIPISNLCQRETVVVLAGDPMQLGPVVYSKDAENYGYGKSYLERLFESEAYLDEDDNYVTKLVRNYRSHPEILYLPSTLFYNGDLIACKEDTSCITSLPDLIANKDFPILFIGVQGCDEREGNNPSWFNRIEASKVVEIIKKLMTSSMNLREEDIGVITPYRQQVLKLKKALESFDVPDIKVGSVEQFQGQERKVIIVSTVRSTIKHNDFDKTHCLGFLSNPRRFNVAVTRAISLLIIIGNPHIISQDTYWNKLLWYCLDSKSYQGCAPPSRQDIDLNDEENPQYEEVEGKGDWGQEPWNQENCNQQSWEEPWDDSWDREPVQTEIPTSVVDQADGWQ